MKINVLRRSLETVAICDFWNLFNIFHSRFNHYKINWIKLRDIVLHEAQNIVDEKLTTMLLKYEVKLNSFRIYASYNPNNRENLQKFFYTLQHRLKFEVIQKAQLESNQDLSCYSCKTKIVFCPSCGNRYFGYKEKQIDSSIITDMFDIYLDRKAKCIILISSDTDFTPAVHYLVSKDMKIINIGWESMSETLREASWGFVDLTRYAEDLKFYE